MAQIRGTIELLSKIFKENGTSKLKAETFRLAKFGKPEATEPLWKLLFEVLYFLEYGKIDDVTIRAYAQMSNEEITVYVKKELAKKGFTSYDFSQIPSDMMSGSRELLLALGWLMSKHHVIPAFMNNVTSPLDDDTSFLYQEDESGDFQDIQNALCSTREDPVTRVHQLLWLNNKLKLNLRNLYSIQQQTNSLKHKIHESTLGISITPERPHLSTMEVYMLRHPEVLKKNLALLDKDNERLSNLLKWEENENVFYKWMESVLDEKIKSQNLAADLESLEQATVPGYAIDTLKLSHFKLQRAITKYEAIVEHIERLWEEKSETVSEEELDSLLHSLELELTIQKANIALNNCETRVERQRQPVMIYQPEKKRDLVAQASSAASPLSEIGDIEAELSMLQHIVNSLEDEVKVKQENFQQEMTALSEKFSDAICIPPMRRKMFNGSIM